MSSKNLIGQEASLEEQAVEQVGGPEVVEETPELRPSVEQEIQGKVDANHPDVEVTGLTLEAEERMEAREAEIRRTRERCDRRLDSDREVRTRRVARQGSMERRWRFAKRAACVNEWAHPDVIDPRAQLTREQLGDVNRAAARFEDELEGWTRAAISRRLAERLVSGGEMASAVLEVFDELKQAPGQVIPIEAVGQVDRPEVDVEGIVETLWKPSHPAIQQVGLLADDTDRIKFTVWRKSGQPIVKEGEKVRLRGCAKSWYQGRVSVALTGWSEILFLDAERW